jgi:hypothetical protein
MPKTILAVAIGDSRKSKAINNSAPATLNGVRPYIGGLINGLSKLPVPNTKPVRNYQIGTDYVIDYRECDLDQLNRTFTSADVIFCMSTRVVRAAASYNSSIPIVGIVSNPRHEGFLNKNICGISGKRSQEARHCYDRLKMTTVPNLKDENVYVLHDASYGPSKDSLETIRGGKHDPRVAYVSPSNIEDVIKDLTPGWGLLVLPVDWFFGAAPDIISWARAKGLVDFWSVTDWVQRTLPSALGGYGVPQQRCGELLAERVAYVLPSGAIPRPEFTDVDINSDVVWKASDAAAAELGIILDSHPQHV